ncbi:prephenate dehydratase domain-containing protein [Candidatus Blochmannia ocreatus (nom. nud.)]|uniref:prephenate dehydratase n=1 Tax=Candidatus Blochmannia ocreatus (nom. nud.) TaxID=251538 RepID=A0ABY4STG4_9ENTR|nr:prephenate dehydratase domain-containing protein [Candidatus Blochmannia ocreatus]URJ25259.1 chorismate mutase [Candidatus Blochmannia ocreatus]
MVSKSTVRVAFLGPKGSYSYIAAMKYSDIYFEKIVQYSCCRFYDIFTLVESCCVEYGIVPIENSSTGLINEVCNLLLNTSLFLVGEITIPIKHCILVDSCVDINHVQTIYSHPQPIIQCSEFLKKYFSIWKIIFCESSAAAMKTVSELNQFNLAALGSMQGGKYYGLHPLLKSNISNCQKNMTKFFILRKKNFIHIKNSINIKTIIIVSINKKSEKLYEIFKILEFYRKKVNYLRTKIVWRNQLNKTIAIIDITTCIYDVYMKQILIILKNIVDSLKILGCYSIRHDTI